MQLILKDYVTQKHFDDRLSEYVTVSHFDKAMVRIDKRFDQQESKTKQDMASMYEAFEMRLDKKFDEVLTEFKRHMGALFEDFQHRTAVLAEIIQDHHKDMHDIRKHLALE